MKTVTAKWFGEDFKHLHPNLQRLHTNGGVLTGKVDITYGRGVASLPGRRLGRKLGLPLREGLVALRVDISYSDSAMIWTRQFGNTGKSMVSSFTPVGSYSNGYWTESTGGIELQLAVEVQNAEWHWIQRAARIKGIAVPAFLMPVLTAWKFVDNDGYHFMVRLHKHGLGLLVQYQGILQESNDDALRRAETEK